MPHHGDDAVFGTVVNRFVAQAAIGHPLTGDWLYGTEDRALIARPALHSYHLRMMHPLTGTTIDVTAPLPEDIQRLLKEERL